jgi:magnesium transporter
MGQRKGRHEHSGLDPSKRGGKLRQRPRRAPPAGAQPGVLALPSDGRAPSVRLMRFSPDACEERELDPRGEWGPLLEPGRGTLWIDVQSFGDAEFMERLRSALGIHPLALADIVNVPQRPKVERYGERVLVIAQMAQLAADGSVELEQLGLVIGAHWIASFQERPGDCFDPLRQRLRSAGTRVRGEGPDYLAYTLLDAVVDAYFPVLESIAQTLDTLEAAILAQPSRATLQAVHGTRRVLLQLRRIQWQQREAIAALMRDEEPPLRESVRVYLRDLHDHALQVLESIETYREVSIGLMDLYLSSANHRMNEAMRTLTVVSTIFIPLTFIAGVYGMNFEYMPELHWSWAYPAVCALMGLTALALAAWFHARGWLRGPPREPPAV